MTSAIYIKNVALHKSRNKIPSCILTFKVKNTVTELNLLTMIVPVFTKRIASKGFLFTYLLPHPVINLSVTQIIPLKQQETFE